MRKPALGFWQIWNISFGFFGIQIGFALQGANVSRIFQTLGASIEALPILWIAGPITGLLVQPLVGHFSDKTWGPLGRRRPYFLVGAILTTLALFVMPNSPYLWVAALGLWILDASINISMEPFRAFVGDMLPKRQHTRGYAMQGVFIGIGALLASVAPFVLTNYLGVPNTAPEGQVPDSVKYAFYLGGIALFLSVGWTIISTKEYSPEEMAAFEKTESSIIPHDTPRPYPGPGAYLIRAVIALTIGIAGFLAVWINDLDKQLYVLCGAIAFLGLAYLLNVFLVRYREGANFLSHILGDLSTMPQVMRRLAIVQFFSWFALFIMWVYATPAVTSYHYGTSDPTSALYNQGADWIGIMFAVYNGVAGVYAFLLPTIANRLGPALTHAVNLVAGAVGMASFLTFTDPMMLLVSMVGVGMAWASILTMPYAMLANALPPQKMGVYMGIFNFFIVIPQLMVSAIMATVLRLAFGNEAIYAFAVAGACLVVAALATFLVPVQKTEAA